MKGGWSSVLFRRSFLCSAKWTSLDGAFNDYGTSRKRSSSSAVSPSKRRLHSMIIREPGMAPTEFKSVLSCDPRSSVAGVYSSACRPSRSQLSVESRACSLSRSPHGKSSVLPVGWSSRLWSSQPEHRSSTYLKDLRRGCFRCDDRSSSLVDPFAPRSASSVNYQTASRACRGEANPSSLVKGPTPSSPFNPSTSLRPKNLCSGSRRLACRAFDKEPAWTATLSPYETLGVDPNATLEDIKSGYRRMAKTFHPDVYSGTPELAEGETVESRFIQIQAAYELLTDRDQKTQYDMDRRVNPMQASKAWRDWVLRKRRAFEQRGELAFSAWAEQQQRDLNLKARALSKAKTDPEEERRLVAKEKAATIEMFETTLKRHTLVLKKRDLERQKAQDAARKKLVADLLLAEGLELEDE